MTHWIDTWEYEEWRSRMPEPLDGDEADAEALDHFAQYAEWVEEKTIVTLAKAGHDSPELRVTWSEEITPTKDQRSFASLVTLALRDTDTNEGVLLFGTVGSGKSRAAGRTAHLLREAGIPTIFVKATQLLDELRDIATDDKRTQSLDDRRKTLATAPALIIDDLGAQRSTEFSREQMTALFDQRYELAQQAPLMTIITTNLTPFELENYLGERAMSRLNGLTTETYEFTGKDLRGASS